MGLSDENLQNIPQNLNGLSHGAACRLVGFWGRVGCGVGGEVAHLAHPAPPHEAQQIHQDHFPTLGWAANLPILGGRLLVAFWHVGGGVGRHWSYGRLSCVNYFLPGGQAGGAAWPNPGTDYPTCLYTTV